MSTSVLDLPEILYSNEKIAEELEARADYLAREDVNWVSHMPIEADEVCMAYHVSFRDDVDPEDSWVLKESLSSAAFVTLENALTNAGTGIGRFNDTHTRAEVVEFLRKTAANLRGAT